MAGKKTHKRHEKPEAFSVVDLTHLNRPMRSNLIGPDAVRSRREVLKRLAATAPLLVLAPGLLMSGCDTRTGPSNPLGACNCQSNIPCGCEADRPDTTSGNVCTCQSDIVCKCESFNPCTCDSQCSCESYCACNPQCSCQSYCACNPQCSCQTTCGCQGQCLCEVTCGCQLYRI